MAPLYLAAVQRQVLTRLKRSMFESTPCTAEHYQAIIEYDKAFTDAKMLQLTHKTNAG